MKIQLEDGMQIQKYRNENTGGRWDANTDADWGKLESCATGVCAPPHYWIILHP